MKVRKRRPLRLYQKQALSYINRVQHPALFIEMRLGKTLITVRWIKSHPEIKTVLVVSPYSAFYGWKRELRLEREPLPVELTGTWEQRSVKLHTSAKWYLINKEGHLVLPGISDKGWDCVILDESTFIKDPTTKASQFFVKNFRDVTHRFILTGTPAPEGELNYFQQLQFLNPEIIGEKDFWSFRFGWFKQICENNYYLYYIAEKSRKRLSKKMVDSCFFLTREDTGLKNIKIYEKRLIPFNGKAQEVYDTLKEEFILELDGRVINSTILSITQFIWMRRLFGGFVEDDYIFDGKLEELILLLGGELKNEPVIIWCSFIQELKFLNRKIKGSQIIYGGVKQKDRETILRHFQNEKITTLIAQPECFKYGLDLSISNTMIYYSTPLGLETRLQTEDRIVDLEKSAALIIDLVIEDSIDMDIMKNLERKESKMQLVKNIVRRLQNEIKKN